MSPCAQKILKSLLGSGYFPKELPPVFTTENFGEHASSILEDWRASSIYSIKTSRKFGKINGKQHAGKYEYNGVNFADPEVISKPKKLYERRNIHITHPIPQALLSREIAENWKELHRVLSRRRFSEDEIIVSARYERSIKGINFPLHRAKKDYIEATSDWLVRTDIARFYPSIYTHSIPWAAYGKERVKNNLKSYRGSFADRLDALVRACNRNQTIGIPIGPETSRILAEIISSRIDDEYAKVMRVGGKTVIDRLQDDWVVGAKTLEAAENIIAAISGCYREFGLDINGSKTSVTHILASSHESWKSEISGFLSHRRGDLQGVRLEEFMNLCLRLQLACPSEPVMNYALSVIEGRRFVGVDLRTLESFILKVAAVSPSSLDRVCRIILNVNFDEGGLSRSRISRRFVDLAERHCDNGALFEVIWLLYAIRGLKVPFRSSKIADYVEYAPTSAIRLLLMDMKQKGACVSRLPIGTWEREISEDRVLLDWSWLYAYEAIRKGWLKGPAKIMSSAFFSPMHRRDVTFYDPSKNVKRSRAVKRSQFIVRGQQMMKVMEFINDLRGMHGQDQEESWDHYG